MSRTDTTEPNSERYECRDCLHREESASSPGPCPECGGSMRNIAVPRE